MSILEGKEGMANFFLRIGLALTILWSVNTKLTSTDKVVGLFKALGLSFMASPGLIKALGVLLLLISVMMIVGWQVRYTGIFLTAFFLVSLLAGMFAGDALFSVGLAICKDFTLIGPSLALALGGAGEMSLENEK